MRRLAQPPPQPPNRVHPRKPTEQSKETLRNARIPAKARPNHRHLPINPPPRRVHENTKHTTTRREHPPARQRATRNSGTAEAPAAAVNHSAGRPAGRNSRTTTTTRAQSAVNAARHPTGTQRRNETGERVRTGGAGRPAAAGGARLRSGRETVRRGWGGRKEVGRRRSWRGIQRGWLTSTTTFVSLSSLSPLLRGGWLRRRAETTLIYGRLPAPLPPPHLHLLGWFLSLHLLPLITWRFPSVFYLFFIFCERASVTSRRSGAGSSRVGCWLLLVVVWWRGGEVRMDGRLCPCLRPDGEDSFATPVDFSRSRDTLGTDRDL